MGWRGKKSAVGDNGKAFGTCGRFYWGKEYAAVRLVDTVREESCF